MTILIQPPQVFASSIFALKESGAEKETSAPVNSNWIEWIKSIKAEEPK